MPVTRACPKSNESSESSASNETTHRGGNVSSVSSRGQGLLRSGGPAVGLRSGTSATDDLDVQSKLRVNEPGDKYEKEAERVADEVMRGDEPTHGSRAPAFTRRTSEGTAGSRTVDSETEAEIRSVTSGGRPLPASMRSFFERRFGSDFSDVRIHTDAQSATTARGLNARAFTAGRHIVFDEGEFRPGTPSGRETLAHELTHVIQQDTTARRGGGPSPTVSEQPSSVARISTRPAAAIQRQRHPLQPDVSEQTMEEMEFNQPKSQPQEQLSEDVSTEESEVKDDLLKETGIRMNQFCDEVGDGIDDFSDYAEGKIGDLEGTQNAIEFASLMFGAVTTALGAPGAGAVLSGIGKYAFETAFEKAKSKVKEGLSASSDQSALTEAKNKLSDSATKMKNTARNEARGKVGDLMDGQNVAGVDLAVDTIYAECINARKTDQIDYTATQNRILTEIGVPAPETDYAAAVEAKLIEEFEIIYFETVHETRAGIESLWAGYGRPAYEKRAETTGEEEAYGE